MSTRSRVLLVCSVIAALAGVTGFLVGLTEDRVWQSLPGLTIAVLVPALYVLSRREDRRR